MQSFGDLCLKVYFAEDTSPYDFISVNAGLFSLFTDHVSTTQMSQDHKERNKAYAHICRENLETALAEMPLQLPASADVVAALLFGAGIAFCSQGLSTIADRAVGVLFYRILHLVSFLVPVFESIRTVPDLGLPSAIAPRWPTISRAQVYAVPLLDDLLH